jgi:hypothetical protein
VRLSIGSRPSPASALLLLESSVHPGADEARSSQALSAPFSQMHNEDILLVHSQTTVEIRPPAAPLFNQRDARPEPSRRPCLNPCSGRQLQGLRIHRRDPVGTGRRLVLCFRGVHNRRSREISNRRSGREFLLQLCHSIVRSALRHATYIRRRNSRFPTSREFELGNLVIIHHDSRQAI